MMAVLKTAQFYLNLFQTCKPYYKEFSESNHRNVCYFFIEIVVKRK